MTAVLLSLMLLLLPALGVPHEALLQDSLKSLIAVFFTFAAGFAFLGRIYQQGGVVRWHGIAMLPVLLMLYALGSMVWSHSYLGGVEAVRWMILSAVVWLGLQSFPPRNRRNITFLLWCIHIGAVLASLWAALQFWMDWQFFSQGPNPASTFVNRNFFAEFLVCTIPFSVLLLTRVADKTSVFLLGFSLAFHTVALMMTGTRSALIALLGLLVVLPWVMWRYRKQWASSGWTIRHRIALLWVLVGTVLALGSLPSTNRMLIAEIGHTTALQRSVARTASIMRSEEFETGSFAIRTKMWQATLRMIADNPITGVGAGAWEVHIPRYQEAGSELEPDYYAHNEPLQLIAEYGVVGWIFLLILLTYCFRTGWNLCFRPRRNGLLPSIVLCSLGAFLWVSNAGFPWRMASSGVLFAFSLALLAASDRAKITITYPLRTRGSIAILGGLAISTGLALHAGQQAVECESKLMRATQIALSIRASGMPNHPEWDKDKALMLQLLAEGIAINPHYRKLTPIAADVMVGWGDWENATWIWKSTLASRPYIVALLVNVAYSELRLGNREAAEGYYQRAKQVQPTAQSVIRLEKVLHDTKAM
ncbi:MAG: hypothetical protein RIR79_687 [Pseudomonadota bacterium]